MRPWIVALVAVLAGIAIALLLITDQTGISEELRLPLLAVICVVTVLMALAFVSTLFASSGLQTTQHALALPEGSVRALIALSLIVVFAVITMFVLARFSRSDVRCIECSELVDALKQRTNANPTSAPSAARTDTTATAATTDTTATSGTSAEALRTGAGGVGTEKAGGGKETPVPANSPTDPITAAIAKRMEAGYDLAKQLLTMLGTLLAAISSFYFGASSTAAASDPTKLKEMGKAVDEIRRG